MTQFGIGQRVAIPTLNAVGMVMEVKPNNKLKVFLFDQEERPLRTLSAWAVEPAEPIYYDALPGERMVAVLEMRNDVARTTKFTPEEQAANKKKASARYNKKHFQLRERARKEYDLSRAEFLKLPAEVRLEMIHSMREGRAKWERER